MRTGGRLALVMILTPAWAVAQQNALRGTVISSLRSAPIRPGQVLRPGTELKTDQENAASLFLWSGAEADPGGLAVVALGKSSVLQLGPANDDRRILEIAGGIVAIRYEAGDGQALVVKLPPDGGSSWVRLTRGAIWVRAGGPRTEVALAGEGGQATRFESALPAGSVQTAPGGQPVQYAPSAAQESRTLFAILEQAALRDTSSGWLSRAETGDLLPNDSRVSNFANVSVPSVQAMIQTQAGAVTQANAVAVTQTPITGTTIGSLQSTLSGVNSLLSSGNPASVIVGARFERARIVGLSSGASGLSNELGFNSFVRPPLTLRR